MTPCELRRAAQFKIDEALSLGRIDWREAYELARIVESELLCPSGPKPTFADLVRQIVHESNQHDPNVVLTIPADQL